MYLHIHNFTMLKVMFVLSCVIFSRAQMRMRCGNGTETNLTFTPSQDGVAARYTAELCTNINRNVTEWKLYVMNNQRVRKCNLTHPRNHPGDQISKFIGNVNLTDLDCTYVCLSTELDLIFSGCYLLKSSFKYGHSETMPYDSYHRIVNQFQKNNVTGMSRILENDFDSGVAIHLFPGLPSDEYTVDIEDTNSTRRYYHVTGNCTSKPSNLEIHCFLTPPHGCYRLFLNLKAPWNDGIFTAKSNVLYPFCRKEVSISSISGDNWSVLWMCGGVLALCVCAFLARWAWRTRTVGKIREQVRKTWVENRLDNETALQQNKDSCKHVLLLYARECEAGRRAVMLLKELLTQVIPGTVYDIFSVEVMSLAASAPAQWIRDVMEQSEVRVVLLQTPALACLYKANLEEADSTFKLQEPLLGSRVVQRSPHFGDTLLHYALRLISETAHHHNAYNKYYIAQLSELKVEILPQIVRFTRYPLPAATTLLLRDISSHDSWEPPEEIVTEYTHAIADFVDYAAKNPNYLMEELMFV